MELPLEARGALFPPVKHTEDSVVMSEKDQYTSNYSVLNRILIHYFEAETFC